ncbi:hypothetical protein T484DRAFT_3411402 [Baffinella frigidus]|nr:hypothetical protein T484DRAFT_3411402 [Cryptophyta sp. CCMP2293]
MNVQDSGCERSSSCGEVEAPVVHRTMRRVVSDKELNGAASVADTSNNKSETSVYFPAFADLGDDGVCSYEESERRSSCEAVEPPVLSRSMRRVGSEEQLQCAASVADTFNNQSRCGSPVSRRGSPDSRCKSPGPWLRLSELPVDLARRLRMQEEVNGSPRPGPLARERHLFDEVAGSPRHGSRHGSPRPGPLARERHLFDEVAGSPRPGSSRHGSPHPGSPRPGPLARERPARAVLPEWPAVDDDLVASSKRHLLTFDLDPTTVPMDVLCHLAMEMFVSAGLPAGLAEDRVRRFILAVRASMLDNPYHNFYHVFDVMQTTHALATSTGTMARLDSWERFALLSAALCHDLVTPKP